MRDANLRRGIRIVSLAAAVLLAGCGPRETAVDSGLQTQTLHIGNLSEPTDLDPQIVTSIQDFGIVQALFEGLTQYDPKTCEAIPGVAERWESSADQRQWTFHLRPNARWSNGDPVTAHDFIFAFRRILSPGLGAEYAYMLFALENAEAFFNGEEKDFRNVGARAVDDRTLELRLSHPVPYLPGLVAHMSWYPLHRGTIERHGPIDQRGSPWTRPGNLVGNGAFVLQEWKPNQFIRVGKSPTYWDAEHIRLNAAVFYPIENLASEEAAFRAGQIHVTANLPIDKISVYKNDPKLRPLLNQSTYLGTYFFRFNVQRPPFNDVRVRRALSLAINREQIVERVTLGGQPPAYGLTPPDTGGYTPGPFFASNSDLARRLLAEAGFPGGAGFPRIELLYNTLESHRKIAEAIQQMWKRELGIDIRLHNQEAKVWVDTMRQGDYSIARFAWVGDYLDPSSFLELMTSTSGNNQTGWSSARYDRLMEEARNSADQARRYEFYVQAERLLMDEAPIAPLYFYVQNSLRHPHVRGWYGNLLNIHPLNRVYLESE